MTLEINLLCQFHQNRHYEPVYTTAHMLSSAHALHTNLSVYGVVCECVCVCAREREREREKERKRERERCSSEHLPPVPNYEILLRVDTFSSSTTKEQKRWRSGRRSVGRPAVSRSVYCDLLLVRQQLRLPPAGRGRAWQPDRQGRAGKPGERIRATVGSDRDR